MGNNLSLCGTCNLDLQNENSNNLDSDIEKINKEIEKLSEKYEKLNQYMLININGDLSNMKIKMAEIAVKLEFIIKGLN